MDNSRHAAIVWGAVIIGVAMLILAGVYWIEPASSLPSFIPGHDAASGHHHIKHGIAALVVGLALLVFAWFRTGGEHRPDVGST